MWLPADSQRPAHLGAPRPHADPPASLSPRQSLGDLGGDGEPPAAALRGLHPFLSREQHHPCGGRGVLARLAPPAPRPCHVLWDGGSIHKGPDVRALLTRCPRLHIERFPYAPDLNPDEFVWTHFKATLANTTSLSSWPRCAGSPRRRGNGPRSFDPLSRPLSCQLFVILCLLLMHTSITLKACAAASVGPLCQHE
jgi:DDE superfamily endonuclease